MKNRPKKYPPCKGGRPYLYFAFAEPGSEKVWPVMRILLGYGCRVWYCLGPAGSAEELLERQTRSGEAELTLLYLSDAACTDNDTKTNVLVNQKYDRPILCLDPDGKDRHLAMALRESVPLIDWHNLGREERKTALLHGEGFSQELPGKPVKVRDTGIFRILTLLFLASAVLASASASAVRASLRSRACRI